MGSQNARAVYARWGDLPDRPFRVLLFMALAAHDDDDPPTCWLGWQALAVGLGRLDESEATAHAVRRAVGVLVSAGALSRTVEHPRTGVRQAYALNLARPVEAPGEGVTERHPGWSHPDREGAAERPPQGAAERPPTGSRSVAGQGAAERSPYYKDFQATSRDTTRAQVATANSGRARGDDDEQSAMVACPACAAGAAYRHDPADVARCCPAHAAALDVLTAAGGAA